MRIPSHVRMRATVPVLLHNEEVDPETWLNTAETVAQLRSLLQSSSPKLSCREGGNTPCGGSGHCGSGPRDSFEMYSCVVAHLVFPSQEVHLMTALNRVIDLTLTNASTGVLSEGESEEIICLAVKAILCFYNPRMEPPSSQRALSYLSRVTTLALDRRQRIRRLAMRGLQMIRYDNLYFISDLFEQSRFLDELIRVLEEGSEREHHRDILIGVKSAVFLAPRSHQAAGRINKVIRRSLASKQHLRWADLDEISTLELAALVATVKTVGDQILIEMMDEEVSLLCIDWMLQEKDSHQKLKVAALLKQFLVSETLPGRFQELERRGFLKALFLMKAEKCETILDYLDLTCITTLAFTLSPEHTLGEDGVLAIGCRLLPVSHYVDVRYAFAHITQCALDQGLANNDGPLALVWLEMNLSPLQEKSLLCQLFRSGSRIRNPATRTPGEQRTLLSLTTRAGTLQRMIQENRGDARIVLLMLALGFPAGNKPRPPRRTVAAPRQQVTTYEWAMQDAHPLQYAIMRDVKCITLLVRFLGTFREKIKTPHVKRSRQVVVVSDAVTRLPVDIWRLVCLALFDLGDS